MIGWIDKLMGPVDNLIDLGSEYIVDKDKLIEFQFKAMKVRQESMDTLIKTKTNPTIDGLVKLMYALNAFWRPFVGAAMTAFGAYVTVKGIEIDPAIQAIFVGAFPAWGVSRHTRLAKELELKKNKQFDDPLFD